jgi:hypothetical protein
LVKLSGAFLIPVALIHYRNWRYLIIPPLVFILVMGPFLLLAGSEAIFFNPSTDRAQHPFQFKGVSLGALWNQMQGETGQIPLLAASVAMIIVVGIAIVIIAWKRFGILQDMIILTTAIYIVSPKLHTGYFSLVALLMAPLIRNRAIAILYLLFGAFAVVADFYKWPIADFRIAFWLMVVTLIMLLGLTIALGFLPSSTKSEVELA